MIISRVLPRCKLFAEERFALLVAALKSSRDVKTKNGAEAPFRSLPLSLPKRLLDDTDLDAAAVNMVSVVLDSLDDFCRIVGRARL